MDGTANILTPDAALKALKGHLNHTYFSDLDISDELVELFIYPAVGLGPISQSIYQPSTVGVIRDML